MSPKSALRFWDNDMHENQRLEACRLNSSRRGTP